MYLKFLIIITIIVSLTVLYFYLDNVENFENSKKSKEISYLYSTNKNNNILLEFCKKLKKLNDVNESNLISKRFNAEYKNKKNIQIKKLEEEIDSIINSFTADEMNKFNAYMLRTNDHASKQLEAIYKAKDNIENSKKIKVNLS